MNWKYSGVFFSVLVRKKSVFCSISSAWLEFLLIDHKVLFLIFHYNSTKMYSEIIYPLSACVYYATRIFYDSRKRTTVNGDVWTCYQSILTKNQKNAVKCSSSVLVDGEFCSQRNVRNPHSNHGNHQKKFDDLVSSNNIKKNCIEMGKMLQGLSISVPAYDIYTKEMAKWVEYCACLFLRTKMKHVLHNCLFHCFDYIFRF